MNLTLIDPNLTAGRRLRPPHFLVIEKRTDLLSSDKDDGEDTKVEFVVEARTDDEAYAREVADDRAESLISDGAGVFDNWDGGWLVEPEWADECPAVAEGWTRYDLRPPEPVDKISTLVADPPQAPELDAVADLERLVSIAGEVGVDRETVLGWRLPEVQAFYRLMEVAHATGGGPPRSTESQDPGLPRGGGCAEPVQGHSTG